MLTLIREGDVAVQQSVVLRCYCVRHWLGRNVQLVAGDVQVLLLTAAAVAFCGASSARSSTSCGPCQSPPLLDEEAEKFVLEAMGVELGVQALARQAPISNSPVTSRRKADNRGDQGEQHCHRRRLVSGKTRVASLSCCWRRWKRSRRWNLPKTGSTIAAGRFLGTKGAARRNSHFT